MLQLCVTEDCWIQAKFYLGLQQDEDLQDGEPFCFSILVGHGQSHTFSVEMTSDLAVWEKSFQRAVFMEVQSVGVSWNSKLGLFGHDVILPGVKGFGGCYKWC